MKTQQQFLEASLCVPNLAEEVSDYTKIILNAFGIVTAEDNPKLEECLRLVRDSLDDFTETFHKARPIEIQAADIFYFATLLYAEEGIKMMIEHPDKQGTPFTKLMDKKWRWFGRAADDYWDKHKERLAAVTKIRDESEARSELSPEDLTPKKVCALVPLIKNALKTHQETTEAFIAYLGIIPSIPPENHPYTVSIQQILSTLKNENVPFRPANETII